MSDVIITVGLIAFGRIDGSDVKADAHDPWTGVFKYNAVFKKELWDAALPKGLQHPALVQMVGVVKDVPIMSEAFTMVVEKYRLFEVFQFNILPCTPHLPENFEYIPLTAQRPIAFATAVAEEAVYQVQLGGNNDANFMATNINYQQEWHQGMNQVQQQLEVVDEAVENGIANGTKSIFPTSLIDEGIMGISYQ